MAPSRQMGNDPESSVELLERAKAGDSEALDRLLGRYLPRLRRWASGRLPHWARDLSDTEDLVQDTVVRTLRHIDDGFHAQREGALQAYLRQAVMNRIRDELRRASRRAPPKELTDDVQSPLASPLDQAIGREATERYEAALAELRDEEREAIVARIELECTYEEMAVMLGKPTANAARVAVRRAVVRLAMKMKHAS
jgi:RNA polymerase sigma-70 factor (ECF subfamily)